MVSVEPLTVTGLLVWAAQPASAASPAHSKSARLRTSATPRIGWLGLVPPTGQVREDVADGDGDEHHPEGDPDRVESAHVERPDDDPQAEAEGGGENEAHEGKILTERGPGQRGGELGDQRTDRGDGVGVLAGGPDEPGADDHAGGPGIGGGGGLSG